ncbi:MAG: hypothetical protein NKF70_08475 [Methanobacterium sp. ERen5]|nr:MAG: hypothetical protein NKF70_08475 [Methanobacterium sp. ERen5]
MLPIKGINLKAAKISLVIVLMIFFCIFCGTASAANATTNQSTLSYSLSTSHTYHVTTKLNISGTVRDAYDKSKKSTLENTKMQLVFLMLLLN